MIRPFFLQRNAIFFFFNIMYVHLSNTSVSFVLFMFNELVYSFSHVQIFSIEICKVFLSAKHQLTHASTVLGHLDHASISNTRNVG